MKKVLSYKDLLVWQKGMVLAEQVYQLTGSFPQSELYSLTNQMRRSAVSIVSNIAEGKGRESPKEYLYFLSIAQGSLAELETQILLSIRLNYLADCAAKEPLSLCDEIGRMLNTMRRKLRD